MSYANFAVDYEQRNYNPERMRNERIERAQAALKKHGFGAMLVFNYENHRYLGYYSTHQYARRRPGTYLLLIQGAGFPYVPEDPHPPEWEERLMPWFKDKMILKTSAQYWTLLGHPDKPDYLDSHWENTAKEIKLILEEHGVANLPCGVDVTNFNMINACQKEGINMVDGNHVMATARMIKTSDEIECLKMAGVIAESAHWEVTKALRPGVTEWQMAGVAANACYKLGAEDMEGPSFVVCSGERTGRSVPAMPTDKIVRPGDLFLIDINGISYQGYRTCFYRTHVVGDKPTEFQKEVYNCAYEAVTALANAIKPGITNYEAQQIWLDAGKHPGKWGMVPKWPEPGRYYFGTIAHHIGLCSGDPGPNIPGFLGIDPSKAPLKLEKNMCFAVEAGCFTWDGSKWAKDGVKIENCGVITENGWEIFYRFPYKELTVCGLPGA